MANKDELIMKFLVKELKSYVDEDISGVEFKTTPYKRILITTTDDTKDSYRSLGACYNKIRAYLKVLPSLKHVSGSPKDKTTEWDLRDIDLAGIAKEVGVQERDGLVHNEITKVDVITQSYAELLRELKKL